MLRMREELGSDSWPYKLIALLVVCGYSLGLGLALIWYEYHPAQRKQDLKLRWFILICLLPLFMILLCNRAIRCVLTLSLPTLCSSRGRALLIALAFFVAAIGPTANILANLVVLLRSLACSEELLRQALGQMLDVMLEPVHAIKNAVALVLDEVHHVMQQVLEVMLRLQDLLVYIIDTLKKCALWLQSVVNLCNKEMGTPWTRCQRSAKRAMIRCRVKLGIFKPLCHLTKLFFGLCYPTKIVDVFCTAFWELSTEMLDKIMEHYRQFKLHIEQMFDVNITFEHDFYFDTNPSRNLSEVAEEIVQDINARLRPFVLLFGWLDLICWIMLLVVLFNALYFYLRYMHSREYQNFYISRPFYAIDKQRKRAGEPTALPLKRSERKKYIKLTSLGHTRSEWLFIARHGFFLLISCIQLFSICFVDYSLFWLLATMSYYGHQQADLEVPSYIDLEVKGGGFVGDIMRAIINAFRPITQAKTLDIHRCLPLPVEPNYKRYIQILILCLFTWFVLFCEPYALRIRHVIMHWYCPERAYERALYLHNKILTKRVSFFKFARRKARAAFLYQDPEGHISCLNWLRAKLSWCWCCRCLLGGMSGEVCVMCAKSVDSSGRTQCDTLGCKGLYCQVCFSESNNTCCLCKRPIDYGDLSDISEAQ